MKLEGKSKSDCNNLTYSYLLTHFICSDSFLPTDSRNMQKYAKMHATTYTNTDKYVRASNSTQRNILSFKYTQT